MSSAPLGVPLPLGTDAPNMTRMDAPNMTRMNTRRTDAPNMTRMNIKRPFSQRLLYGTCGSLA